MIELIFSIFALCFGLYSLYLWIAGKTDKFGKLEPMKKMWGEKVGTMLHIFGYVVVPLLVGIFLLTMYFLEKQ